MSTKATNFVPQSEASKKASNDSFKRFAARLADMAEKEQAEKKARET